uniref:Uncharacterized protein n=1 Tax=Adineta vaga TaxID=104782 RepID=B3G4R0_ADIVA|nr:hypothetical protein [Adineta vaga]
MNLVINGDAETGDCSKTKPYDKQPTGWKYTGSPIQVAYAAEWNQDNSTPGPSDRGQCYFAGYETANNSMWQTININDATTLSLLDSEKVSANLSAWLGGYYSQDDNAKVTLNFYNQDGTKIGNAITIGPVLAVDREKKSELLFRTNNGKVPAGTRSMIVLVEFTIINGRDNDGAADNIAVVLSASG